MDALIIDDHPLIRRAIKQLLLDHFGEVNFAEVHDGESAVAQARTREWDIILLDLGLRSGNGLHYLADIKRVCPAAKVLIVSSYAESEFAIPALRAGASGYLAKDRAAEELILAVERILAGGRYLSLDVADRFASLIFDGEDVQPHEKLSTREFQVMMALAVGSSIKDISIKLNLSDRTVSTYRARVLEKMQLKCNAELTEYCLRKGLWTNKDDRGIDRSSPGSGFDPVMRGNVLPH